MKIKFKKILPILGLLSIGVAAPIISTACSSTSETPGDNTTPQEPVKPENTEITFNSEAFNKYFAELDNAKYGDLSQNIDPEKNNELVGESNVKDFVKNLGFKEKEADKFDKITVSLEEKAPASQEGGGENASLFTGAEGTEQVKTLFNAEIVMTLKKGSTWNDESKPSNGTLSDENKTLTLNDVTTQVEKVEDKIDIEIGKALKTKIEEHLKTLKEESPAEILKVEKLIQDSLNTYSKPKVNAITLNQPSDKTEIKYVRKVVVKLVEENGSTQKAGESSSGSSDTFKKANVTIFFGENVSINVVTTGTDGGSGKKASETTQTTNDFKLYNENLKSAITTTNPINTGIADNSAAQRQK